MRLIIPPIEVQEHDAFKNDILDRKNYGQSLLNLITQSEDELVIALTGKWGEGKTTFVKMWQGLLNDAQFPNLYIDAFANDYVDDAFISVASAITAFAEANVSPDNLNTFNELKDKAKKIGGQFLSWSAKIALKAATLGIIKDSDLEELKDIKDDLAKSVSGIVGDFIEERLTSHAKDVELIQSFKILLSDLPSQLNINVKNNTKKPLVIIIDELDRCKPTFAVEILEKIKHLFAVKNIIFVLVMHKEQLEESIKCVYGQNIDAHTYLQKFISLETRIPKQVNDPYNNDIRKYCHKLFELHELETWGDEIVACVEALANHLNLSLRQLEKTITSVALLYGSSQKNELRIPPLIAFLSIVKAIKPSIFELLVFQKITFSKVCDEFNLENIDEEQVHASKLIWIRNWLKFCLLPDHEFNALGENDEIRRYSQVLLNYLIRRNRIITLFAERLNLFRIN